MTTYRRFRDVLEESLKDPEVRAEWDRTALARDVSIWLLRYRKEHGLTQNQLAEQLGWRQPAVARLESGEHEPSLSTLHHLIEHLGGKVRIDIEPDRVVLKFAARRRALRSARATRRPLQRPPRRGRVLQKNATAGELREARA